MKIAVFGALFLLFTLTHGLAAHANEVARNVTPAYLRCEAAASSELDSSLCLEGELSRQKANLKAALSLRLSQMDEEGAGLLRSAQEAWTTFLEADCKAQMIRGGSAASQSWLTCMVRLTANRAIEMETYGIW